MSHFKINPDDKYIAIPNSKRKMLRLLLGALGFVALGIWFIARPEMLQDSYHPRPVWEIVAIGYMSVVFFGACAVIGVYFLISNKAGLVIDDNGIAIAAPFGRPKVVSWAEIKDFKIGAVRNVAFIYIDLNDAEKFIRKQKGAIRRKMMQLNNSQFNAPLSISTTSLSYEFNQLYDLLRQRLSEFKAAEKRLITLPKVD